MNRYEKFEHWQDIAEYDLGTAEAMLNSGRYVYVVFMCQQSVEKYVKGLYVLGNDDEPPRTHNIKRIFNKISFDFNMSDPALEQEYLQFFKRLHSFYVAERYPSYKEKISASVTVKEAEAVFSKTKETMKWLKSLKTSN